MENYLRGINPVLHEGRISGTFDMLVSDMAQVEYDGRVMMVLVADVTEMKVKTIKGDQTAFWTFKGADAAIVRDDGMKEHLARTLHLDSDGINVPFDNLPFPDDVARGATLEGVYDDEGAFLGFQPTEDTTVDKTTGEVLNHGLLTEEEEENILAEVKEQVDAPFARRTKPKDPRPKEDTPTPHIRHRDPALEAFLNEPASV